MPSSSRWRSLLLPSAGSPGGTDPGAGGHDASRILGIGSERPACRRQTRAVRSCPSERCGCPKFPSMFWVSCSRCGRSSRSRRSTPSGWLAPRRSGRWSDSGYSTIPASSGPAATKRTAAGPRSSSRRGGAGSLSESGCPDGAETPPNARLGRRPQGPPKELGKARAMANILAAQSAEMRAKAETMMQQADRLLCDSWTNECGPTANRSIRRRPSTRP